MPGLPGGIRDCTRTFKDWQTRAADCVERSWDVCGVILRSRCDRLTDVPSHLTTSIYSGTSVEKLRWDCNRMGEYIWMIRIVVMSRL